MKILVTGGSGTVGQYVIKQLLQQNVYQIVAFDIKTKRSHHFYSQYKNRLEVIYGDITDSIDINSIFENYSIDTVIHLAAVIPPLAEDNPFLAYQVNVIGTKNIIHAIEKFSPNSFLIYSSSVSVYGDRLHTPFILIDDPLKPSPHDQYAQNKITSEKLIKESNINWSIFRLSAIMGVNNHKISKLMFHMPLATSIEITTPEDTARAFVNAIHKKNKLNKTIYNLGGGENCRISYKDLLERSFTIFGLGKLNFPKKSFAEKNFHCGYYKDGHLLEKIISFRKDSIESYFQKVEHSIPLYQKVPTFILKSIIKRYLLRKSEPYIAYKENNSKLIHHYFNQ